MAIVVLSCAGCDAPMQKTRASKPQGEAYCNPCRKSGAAIKHGTQYAYKDKRCRCAECKEGQRLRIRAYDERVRLRDGVSYSTQRRRKLRGADPLAVVLCVVCDEPLAHVRSDSVERPAHNECKEREYFYVPRSVRLSIYERDEWTCTICNHPAKPDAHYLSDWYPTLDHIVPQSARAVPSHSPENLRLAHRYCNMARGNRDVSDEEVAQRANARRLIVA